MQLESFLNKNFIYRSKKKTSQNIPIVFGKWSTLYFSQKNHKYKLLFLKLDPISAVSFVEQDVWKESGNWYWTLDQQKAKFGSYLTEEEAWNGSEQW